MAKQAPAALPAASSRRFNGRRVRLWLDAFGMLLPTILGVLIFFLVPLGISFYLSFTDARLFGDPNIIGFSNYQRALSDPTFYRAMWNTAAFSMVTLVVSTVPALLLAVILNERIAGRTFFGECFLFRSWLRSLV